MDFASECSYNEWMPEQPTKAPPPAPTVELAKLPAAEAPPAIQGAVNARTEIAQHGVSVATNILTSAAAFGIMAVGIQTVMGRPPTWLQKIVG